MHFARNDVCRDGDHPRAAKRADGGGVLVVAGPDGEAVAAEVKGLLDQGEAAGGLLDADDVRVLREHSVGLGGAAHAGAGWDVVDDERAVDGVGDGGEVTHEPTLRRLVVVGRDDQNAVRARCTGLTRECDGGGGVVRAGADDDRDAAVYLPDGPLDDLGAFGIGQRCALAGRRAEDKRIGAGGDMPFDQLLKGGEVDAVGRHWRHERNAGAAE